MQFALSVYKVTANFPRDEIYGLTAQVRRAAVSVPSNIAEGQGRIGDKSFRVFLSHARGSLYEAQTQIELARGLEYLSHEIAESLLADSVELARMLNGLLRVLDQ
jgi:four helix bundle protein